MIPRLLDRYVAGLWLKLFVLTALGFPLVSILINLTDSLNKLLDRGLTVQQGRVGDGDLQPIEDPGRSQPDNHGSMEGRPT